LVTDKIEYLKSLKLVDGDLELVFTGREKATEPDAEIDSYKFAMLNRATGESIGGINLRAGFTENIVKYRGNIGFTVFEGHRGHHYSSRSCLLLKPVFDFLGLEIIYITCDEDNAASKKNIEGTGAKFLGVSAIPGNYEHIRYYPEGSRKKLRYEWRIR
jgi:predicted acetyltransferase